MRCDQNAPVSKIAGAIESFQNGSTRATVSFKLSFTGLVWRHVLVARVVADASRIRRRQRGGATDKRGAI